jgi:agmatinase
MAFDRQKLERLRAKFGDAGGNEIFDPHFRAVANSVFKDSDKRPPPYGGVPTLLRAPFRPDFAVGTQDKIDIALLGVPMDLGVTNRSGARFGLRAVRSVERVGTYEHVLRMAPLAEHSVADIGDVPLSSRYDLAACHKDIEAFAASLFAADIVPLSVGGDHSISLPLLRAVGKDRPVGMIQIDAHCDTSGSFEGCKFHHGGPFRQAVLDGVLDPERTIQIGIRGNTNFGSSLTIPA